MKPNFITADDKPRISSSPGSKFVCFNHKAGFVLVFSAEQARAIAAELIAHADQSEPVKKAESADQDAFCPGYLVWNPENSTPKYVHSTMRDAVTEAMRLAETYVDRRFFVMAPVLETCVEVEIIEKPRPLRVRSVSQIAETAFDLSDEIPF